MSQTEQQNDTSPIDTKIVTAAIHPAIGVARVGDAPTEYYLGPEVTAPQGNDENFYRTPSGQLKREAVRYRIYGYNANGDVVKELTCDNANIIWHAHIANRKANWFQFITALDIPETKDLVTIRRNKDVKEQDRHHLIIDGGPCQITGINQTGAKAQKFDQGKFKDIPVYLGEMQTDDKGRLLMLGAHGVSKSPSGAPPYDDKDGDSFNNANDWYDDIADGPIDATVEFEGNDIPVEGAWMLSAPPNYAPDVVSWRTMYDLMVDTYIANGWMSMPVTTSFTQDILPQLQRLSNLQWVNKGFFAMFGKDRPMDFNDPQFIAQLSQTPTSLGHDIYGELRQQLFNAFRPNDPKVNEPRIWPWIYGDSFNGDVFARSTNTMLALPQVAQIHLKRWAKGTFIDDYNPTATPVTEIDQLPVTEQPAMLDKAPLHYCLADAFHPGCEMTWPMRHATIYSKPFRIRRRTAVQPPEEYGPTLNQQQALAADGPLNEQGPGDISQYMGLPWQGDTAYCRAGYTAEYDMYVPTFWPARVPNTVLSEEDYAIVIDCSKSRAERLAAYSRRVSWYRSVDNLPTPTSDVATVMERMIATFGSQGIVLAKPGVQNDPQLPAVIYVENITDNSMRSLTKAATLAANVAVGQRKTQLQQAGWDDTEHLENAIKLRARKPTNRS